MNSLLPPTGTEDILELLSPFVPDDYLNEQWPRLQTGGRRHHFSAVQLWRLHLLALITPVHSFNLLVRLLPEQKAWRRFAHLRRLDHLPDVRMMNAFREEVGVSGLRQINSHLLDPLIENLDPTHPALALIDATDLPAACSGFKKKHGPLFRRRCRFGWTHPQSGQSQCFVGYKKHTFRLWVAKYPRGVLSVPLVTWSTPANVSESGLLVPSLAYCVRRWAWRPDYVVADMGYLGAEAKRFCRQRWRVTVLTHVRANMKMVPPFESETLAVCPQGQC
jgi:hypothetical protein